jgi:hypothetical protein
MEPDRLPKRQIYSRRKPASNQLSRPGWNARKIPRKDQGQEKAAAADAAAFQFNPGAVGISYLSPSPAEGAESPEPVDGAGLGAAGAGVAQLGAAAGAGFGAGGFGARGFGAGGFGAGGFGAGGFGAAGVAAAFLAGAFLALAFFAGFFGAAALDFLADFFAGFLADFFEDFFADFFFAATAFFLLFLYFLPPFFFLPLAIVILLVAADQCLSSVSSRPPQARGQSISSILGPSTQGFSIQALDRLSPSREAQSCAPQELTCRRQSAACIQYCPQQSCPA